MNSKQRTLCFLLALCVAVGSASAQEAASPINDLLRGARDALNDLKFARADTIAREILGRGLRLRRSQAVGAWQVIAAAHFPEDGARDTAQARAALREVISRDLDAAFPIDMRWSGLDTLFAREKRNVFGMAPRIPRNEVMYGGSAGDVFIRVATSLPATSWLIARESGNNTEIFLDSATSTTEASLRIRALTGNTPVLVSGAYEFIVRSREPQSGVVLERTIQGSVTASPLELVPVPARVDSTSMRPEISRTNRAKGITTGAVFGALTIAVGKALRAGQPVRRAGADNRAITVGMLIALGTGVAVWFDKGEVLKANQTANATARNDNLIAILAANSENERRTVGYRAKVTLLLDDR